MNLCQKEILIKENENGSAILTYCMLEKNHDGDCRALISHCYNRCESISELGYQCGLPRHHFGRHQSSKGLITWDSK